MTKDTIIAAYYYPGWHPCPVRDAGFKKGFLEWDLVFDAKPHFERHEQPNIPLWGKQDESSPIVFDQKIEAAARHGINAFVFAYYWSRGKRLLEGALDRGYLGSSFMGDISFALMWANRMPRKVLPVKDPKAMLIDPNRLVYTDPDDFLEFIKHIASRYFSKKNYFRIDGAAYLSIFDTNFFIRQMGPDTAKQAIARAREWLSSTGHGPMHLGAIDPAPRFSSKLGKIGFDSVTHYVLLPDWKGPKLQDFDECANKRAAEWSRLSEEYCLPYFPSVSPGWDATPRSVDYGKEKPNRYPWSPIVTGRNPKSFEEFLSKATVLTHKKNPQNPIVFVSSWNEWSEGHYLEPDERFGYDWLNAVRNIRGVESIF